MLATGNSAEGSRGLETDNEAGIGRSTPVSEGTTHVHPKTEESTAARDAANGIVDFPFLSGRFVGVAPVAGNRKA
jgi:hypothetical protein